MFKKIMVQCWLKSQWYKNKYCGMLGILVVISGIVVLYGRLIDSEVLGFIHDDGVYTVLGQSLAQGKGYHLLHVPGEPAQVKYPFFYPLMLSLVWLLNPHFPQNIMWFSGLSIAFSALAALTLSVYCRIILKLSWWLTCLIIMLSFSNFFSLSFYTIPMSESLYLFLSLLTLLWATLIAHDNKKEKPAHWQWIIMVALSAMLCMTRLLGITLVGAIGVWLITQKQYRQAILYWIACFMFGLLPWLLWTACNTQVVNDLNYPLLNTYSNYGSEIVNKVFTGQYFQQIQISCLMLIDKLTETLIPVASTLATEFPVLKHSPALTSFLHWGIAYSLFGYLILLGVKTVVRYCTGSTKNSVTISGLYVAFYLTTITLWNYHDQMSRFIIVLTPLLWLLLFRPLTTSITTGWAQQKRGQLVLTCLLVTGLILTTIQSTSKSYQVISKARKSHWIASGQYPWLWNEYQDSFQWIKQHLPEQAILASFSDVVYSLYTERKTFYIFFSSLQFVNNKPVSNALNLLLNSMEHYHVNYLVVEPHMESMQITAPENIVMRGLLEAFPNRFIPVYESPRSAIHIYRILPQKLR